MLLNVLSTWVSPVLSIKQNKGAQSLCELDNDQEVFYLLSGPRIFLIT